MTSPDDFRHIALPGVTPYSGTMIKAKLPKPPPPKTGRLRKLLRVGCIVFLIVGLGGSLLCKWLLGFYPLEAFKAVNGDTWKDLKAAAQVAKNVGLQPALVSPKSRPDSMTSVPGGITTSNLVMRFLDVRYGPMTEATNRQAAFKDFFNLAHIEGLYLMTGNRRGPLEKKFSSSIAQTIVEYRRIMLPEEKEALRDYFRTEAGRAQVRKATACYLSKDVRFRDVSTPVIQELLTTLTTLEQP